VDEQACGGPDGAGLWLVSLGHSNRGRITRHGRCCGADNWLLSLHLSLIIRLAARDLVHSSHLPRLGTTVCK